MLWDHAPLHYPVEAHQIKKIKRLSINDNSRKHTYMYVRNQKNFPVSIEPSILSTAKRCNIGWGIKCGFLGPVQTTNDIAFPLYATSQDCFPARVQLDT